MPQTEPPAQSAIVTYATSLGHNLALAMVENDQLRTERDALRAELAAIRPVSEPAIT